VTEKSEQPGAEEVEEGTRAPEAVITPAQQPEIKVTLEPVKKGKEKEKEEKLAKKKKGPVEEKKFKPKKATVG